MSLLHLAILLPLFASLFIPIIRRSLHRIHTGWFVLAVPVSLVLFFSRFVSEVAAGGVRMEKMPWIPSLGIDFTVYVDGLSLLFALLITGIGALVVLYSIYYLDKKESLHTFYVYLLLFMTAMLGVVLSDNMIVLYLFWEMTSISSFLLIGYWYQKERSRYGAQKSMLITVFGGLAMLGGISILSLLADTFSIREVIAASGAFKDEPFYIAALVLILLGAFTKSAQFPFHIWLPDAMEAPTPVSAYLHSATMVKAGLYLVARMSPVFADTPLWFYLVSGVGMITLLYGSVSAVRQTDLKAILAYSTVSQLGLIMSLLGVGSLSSEGQQDLALAATVAAIFHLMNHATFKGSLFMMAGIIDHETGTRDIRKLGGLAQVMPVSLTIALIGTLSMAGVPPFNGFLSKEMFLTALTDLMHGGVRDLRTYGTILLVLGVVASIFTFVYSLMLVKETFFGKRNELPKKAHEAPVGMLVSPLVLVTLVVLVGLFPNALAKPFIIPAVEAVALKTPKVDIYMWHGFNLELALTILIFGLGAFLVLTLRKWNRQAGAGPFNRIYDASLVYGERSSTGLHDAVMTGYMRSYLVYIFGFIVTIVLSTLWLMDGFSLPDRASDVTAYEMILLGVMLISAVAITFARSRLTSIVLLGVVGYSVALFFVLFRAPDLALTQLVIETVSVALFLLVFYHMPDISRKEERIKFKLGNAAISILVGATVTLVALSALAGREFASISSYYIKNVYDLAGGGNMVNVILVDFRGFDTLFEISVLAIAALGIYAMIKFRKTGGNPR